MQPENKSLTLAAVLLISTGLLFAALWRGHYYVGPGAVAGATVGRWLIGMLVAYIMMVLITRKFGGRHWRSPVVLAAGFSLVFFTNLHALGQDRELSQFQNDLRSSGNPEEFLNNIEQGESNPYKRTVAFIWRVSRRSDAALVTMFKSVRPGDFESFEAFVKASADDLRNHYNKLDIAAVNAIKAVSKVDQILDAERNEVSAYLKNVRSKGTSDKRWPQFEKGALIGMNGRLDFYSQYFKKWFDLLAAEFDLRAVIASHFLKLKGHYSYDPAHNRVLFDSDAAVAKFNQLLGDFQKVKKAQAEHAELGREYEQHKRRTFEYWLGKQ